MIANTTSKAHAGISSQRPENNCVPCEPGLTQPVPPSHPTGQIAWRPEWVIQTTSERIRFALRWLAEDAWPVGGCRVSETWADKQALRSSSF